LTAKNKTTPIGALAVSVLRYSFAIINWRSGEIRKFDRKTAKILTMYKVHHPEPDIDRLYVKGTKGGRGLLQIEATRRADIINTAECLNTRYKEDQFVNIFKSHESNQTNTNSTIKRAAKVVQELTL
jgi:hypothetical protein